MLDQRWHKAVSVWAGYCDVARVGGNASTMSVLTRRGLVKRRDSGGGLEWMISTAGVDALRKYAGSPWL
jgi:hypothetical protein